MDVSLNKRGELSRLPGIRLSERQNFLLVLSVSLGIRVIAMLRVGIIGNDGLTYMTIATEILEGRWLHSNRTLLFNPYSAAIALLHHWTGIDPEVAGMILNAIPCGLAVVPLYFWCRDAFDRRVALIAAWIHALHPMLIRYSAPVMRDGLFWFCMLAAIQLGWSALNGRGKWRFLLAGLFATCATITRTEGLVLFVLLTLWAILLPRNSTQQRFVLFRRCMGTLGSVAVYPAVIVALNLAVLPPDEPLSGFERFGFLSPATSEWIAGLRKQLSPVASNSLPPSTPSPLLQTEQKFVSNSYEVLPTSVSTTVPSITIPIPTVPDASIPAPLRTMRQLMDQIHVWNDVGDNMDTDGYYLRSFLTLAEEHKHALYLSMFFREFQHGFRVPILIALAVGIRFSRRYWRASRDVPLLGYALLITGAIYYHLMKTNIVESRYLLSAIPFVFPWSAVGIRRLIILGRMSRKNRDWSEWLVPQRLIPACAIVSGVMVFWALRLTRDEAFQKQAGLQIARETRDFETITGNATFARAGYYAGVPYRKLPPHPDRSWNQIAVERPGFVLLRDSKPGEDPLVDRMNGSSFFERVYSDDPRFDRYLIYRLRVTPPQDVAHRAD